MSLQRCRWVTQDAESIAYHDHEWGVPCFDRRMLFEMLCLEGQQAGLAWITILKKREAYRQFIPEEIVQMSKQQLDALMHNPGIIRNRLKIRAIINNAHALLSMEAKGENFSEMIWSVVNHQPKVSYFHDYQQAPVTSPEANQLSKILKKCGFTFTGPIICHAYMQACGLINDHQTNCFCHPLTNGYPTISSGIESRF